MTVPFSRSRVVHILTLRRLPGKKRRGKALQADGDASSSGESQEKQDAAEPEADASAHKPPPVGIQADTPGIAKDQQEPATDDASKAGSKGKKPARGKRKPVQAAAAAVDETRSDASGSFAQFECKAAQTDEKRRDGRGAGQSGTVSTDAQTSTEAEQKQTAPIASGNTVKKVTAQQARQAKVCPAARCNSLALYIS